MVLKRADLEATEGLLLPAEWPEENLAPCPNGAKVEFNLKEGVVPDLRWRFVMRRRTSPEPYYRFLKTAWKDFVKKNQLIVGDKIVIEVVETIIDLNLSLSSGVVVDGKGVFGREYAIKAQRRDAKAQWVDIPPPQTRQKRVRP